MNKKANTVIFMLIATIINILLMIALGLVTFIILYKIFGFEDFAGLVIMIVSMAVGIGGSLLIYTKVVNWLNKTGKLEAHLAPLLKPRHKGKKGN